MPTSIRRKRSLRENVAESAVRRGKAKRISTWKQIKFSIAMVNNACKLCQSYITITAENPLVISKVTDTCL